MAIGSNGFSNGLTTQEWMLHLLPLERIASPVGMLEGLELFELPLIHLCNLTTGGKEFSRVMHFARVIHQEPLLALRKRATYSTLVQYANECEIFLTMDGPEINMNKIALAPCVATERPFVLVTPNGVVRGRA